MNRTTLHRIHARDLDPRRRSALVAAAARILRTLTPTADAVADGTAWYAAARDWIAIVAARTGLPRTTVAAIVAALSPRCSWDENLRRALWACTTRTAPPGLTDQARKVEALLAGADPDTVLGGHKVRSFYRNLTGDETAVTVDIWALRAVYPRQADDIYTAVTGSAWKYEVVADAFRQVAAERGLTPAAFQAAAWVTVRGAAA